MSIDNVSRDTRISSRYLEALEADDHPSLPGLVFTRGFIRQYAAFLKLDPGPLLAELPKPDESTAPLPEPPARPRSFRKNRAIRSTVASLAWVLPVCAAAAAIYLYPDFLRRHFLELRRAHTQPAPRRQPTATPSVSAALPTVAPPVPEATAAPEPPPPAAPVQVSLTAHDEAAWVQVSADGRPTFTGTLKPNETREVSASEQIKVSTGNAGALTILLNGKTLDPLGPLGEIRVVRLTAEGPEFLSKSPPRPAESVESQASDPL